MDIGKLDKYLEERLKMIKASKLLSDCNKEIILRYLKESALGQTVGLSARSSREKHIAIGAGRNLQAAGFLMQMATEWFKKDLDKVTVEDMEKFISALDKGKLTTQFHKPYASESKTNIKKFLRKFYKWLLGNNKNYPPIVDWLDTSKKDTTIEAVPGLKDGVWKIVELIPDIKRKAMVWALFDCGFREGELINCTIKDIEKNSDGIYYLTCRYSKTKPRTVSLPYSSELVGRWLEQHPDKNNPNAQLWQTGRVMLYKTIKLYGEKALNRNVTVHMLRHTSATYWAPRLDRVTLCKRFGWSYSSQVPDRYIDFSKATETKIADVVKAEKYTELSKKLEEQTIQNQMLKEQMEHMNKLIQAIQNEQKIREKQKIS